MNGFTAGMMLSTLIEAMAVMVEVAAMKTANRERELRGESPAYDETAFREKVDHLWACSNQAREQVR
jgi:hypothetical protein